MRHKVGDAWHSITYAELGERIRTAAKALLELGIRPGDKVGIFSPNRPEWAIADFAILSVGAISVAIYATETTKGAEYLARDAEVRLVFVGGQAQYDKVKSFIAAHEQLETIVAFDDEVAARGRRLGALRATSWTRGRASSRDGRARRVPRTRHRRRHRDVDLHLGNDRCSQGRDPHARKLLPPVRRRRRALRGGLLRSEPVLPSPQPRLREVLVVLTCSSTERRTTTSRIPSASSNTSPR